MSTDTACFLKVVGIGLLLVMGRSGDWTRTTYAVGADSMRDDEMMGATCCCYCCCCRHTRRTWRWPS